jgi:hypothetical protein
MAKFFLTGDRRSRKRKNMKTWRKRAKEMNFEKIVLNSFLTRHFSLVLHMFHCNGKKRYSLIAEFFDTNRKLECVFSSKQDAKSMFEKIVAKTRSNSLPEDFEEFFRKFRKDRHVT